MSLGVLGLRMRTMSFRTLQYGTSQVILAVRPRLYTCLGQLRAPEHLTTTPRRCSDNRVVARMQPSDVLDTKRCGKPAWLRARRVQPSTRQMSILPLLGCIWRLSHAFRGIGENTDDR